MKMPVSDQDQSTHPKLRSIKSHPYLNTYSTPPLPKPAHFHQLSDQTGQSSHPHLHNNHQHQLSTISLPQQFPVKQQSNNPFELRQLQQSSTFKPFQTYSNQPIYAQIDKQTHQANSQLLPPPPPQLPPANTYQPIDKQPIYLNGNIEQYETTFSYDDLDKRANQQIYINHPIRQIAEPVKSLNGYHSNGQINSQITNGQPVLIQLNGHFSEVNNHLNGHHETTVQQVNHPLLDRNLDQNITQTTTYHGLPMKFVKALKKLFDVFDAQKCGLIRIADIENRIKDEEFDEELDRPQDLIDSLRKVTSPNGLINFSNFCAAINICLLKNQLAKNKQLPEFKPSIATKPKSDRNDSYIKAQQNIDKSAEKNGIAGYSFNGYLNGHHTSGSHLNHHKITNGNYSRQYHHQQSSLNSNSPLENSSFTSTSSSNSSSRLHKDFNKLSLLKSNQQNSQALNSKLKYRPSSVPVEFKNNNEDDDESDCYKKNIQPGLINKKLDGKAKSMGNLKKEQLYANKLRQCSSESRLQQSAVVSSQAIMEKLFEWRNNLLEKKLRSMNNGANGHNPFTQPPTAAQPNPQLNHLYSIVNKKTSNHRKIDEQRRHTVTSLHSLNTAKKLLNMKKEKDLLQQGLHNMDRAKQFYIRQLEIVQNQIDYLNQYTQSGNNFFINQLNSDYNIKQHLDKLSSLEQMNKNLVLLIDGQFTQTSRLSSLPEIELQKQNLTIFKLKEQVQMLSEELLRKTNIITNLEKSNPFLKIQP